MTYQVQFLHEPIAHGFLEIVMKDKKRHVQSEADVFLTAQAANQLFPELEFIFFFGASAKAVSREVVNTIMNSELQGIKHNKDGTTVLLAPEREGADIISLALTEQDYKRVGPVNVSERIGNEEKIRQVIKFEREEPYLVIHEGSPVWEQVKDNPPGQSNDIY